MHRLDPGPPAAAAARDALRFFIRAPAVDAGRVGRERGVLEAASPVGGGLEGLDRSRPPHGRVHGLRLGLQLLGHRRDPAVFVGTRGAHQTREVEGERGGGCSVGVRPFGGFDPRTLGFVQISLTMRDGLGFVVAVGWLWDRGVNVEVTEHGLAKIATGAGERPLRGRIAIAPRDGPELCYVRLGVRRRRRPLLAAAASLGRHLARPKSGVSANARLHQIRTGVAKLLGTSS